MSPIGSILSRHAFGLRKLGAFHLDKESGNWKNNQMFSDHALKRALITRPDGAVIILLKSFNN